MTLVTPAGHRVDIQRIVDELKQIDPGFGIAVIPMMDQEAVWAITLSWEPGDRRWREVFEGKRRLDEAWDILCWLPKDCPLDQAKGYLERTLRRRAGREDIAKMLRKVHDHNDRVRKNASAKTMELANELISVNRKTLADGVRKRPEQSADEKAFRDFVTDTGVEDV